MCRPPHASSALLTKKFARLLLNARIDPPIYRNLHNK
uniref:Uncharacterized protein n=1 Tax=Salmonella phage PMBT26 TaxID=3229745 RepID=A0AB39C1J8_9CAUD